MYIFFQIFEIIQKVFSRKNNKFAQAFFHKNGRFASNHSDICLNRNENVGFEGGMVVKKNQRANTY